MATNSQPGIKVGSAFVEINPRMDIDELTRQLATFEDLVKKTYKRQSDVTKAYARLQQVLDEQVTARHGEALKGRLSTEMKTLKARQNLSKTESAMYLKAIEAVEAAYLASEKRKAAAKEKAATLQERVERHTRDLQVRYGQEAADHFLARVAKMQAANRKMTLSRISDAKAWAVSEAVENQKVVTAAKAAHAQLLQLTRMELAEKKTAAREAQAVYTETFNKRRSEILAEMELSRTQRVQELRGLMEFSRSAAAANQRSIREATAARTRLETENARSSKSVAKMFKDAGTGLHGLGTTVSEFGRTITRSIVTPIATATAAMAVFGAKSADSIIQAQTALQRMGLSNADTTRQVDTLKNYGTATPYSVEDMFKYGTQYARAGMAHGLSSTKASQRSTDLVKALGDLSAFAGITDPAQVSRAMYAVSIMQDADRASLRNVKSLADNAGIPIQELAETFGFSDRAFSKKEIKEKLDMQAKKGIHIALPKEYTASAQMMDWMADAKTTGGVPGEGIVEAIIKRGQSSKVSGSAISQGSATISARLSNMAESAKYGLSDLFIRKSKDKDGNRTGPYEYTGAGEALMGKKVTDNREYIQTGVGPGGIEKYKKNPNFGKSHYEGGLLESVSDLGKTLKGPSAKLVKELFTDLATVAKYIKEFADYLKNHPKLTDSLIKIVKIGAVIGGGALVLGTFFKLVGGITKAFSPLLKVAGTAGKLVTGGISAARGRGFSAGYQRPTSAFSTRPTNQQQRETLDLDISAYQRSIAQAEQDLTKFKEEIRKLNGESLREAAHQLAGSDHSVQHAARQAEEAVKSAESAARKLNDQKLRGLNGQFTSSKDHANGLRTSAQNVVNKVSELNREKLTKIAGQVNTLKGDLDDTAKKAGAGKDSLKSRLTEVNNKGTGDVTRAINKLKDALGGAAIKAEELNLALDSVEKHNGGSGGSSKGKGKGKKPPKTSSATGGILPGYTPGVDVHKFISPTGGELNLSGGEAVMRPEWTAAMGPAYVNEMNEAARKGGKRGVRKAMGFKKGGILSIDKLTELMKFRDVIPDALADFSAMRLHGAADKLGGGLKRGVKAEGTEGAKFVGSDLADKFKNMYDWMSHDSWEFLKKLPLPDGLSQAVGIVGGALGPVSGELFWDDIWKGNGNILQRGSNYLGDLFSPNTVLRIVEDFFGGGWDSIKSLFGAGKKLLTDPSGFVTDAVDEVWDLTKAQFGSTIDMVKGVKDIWESPLGYAGQVIKDTYSTAKDMLPNTKGLFDFSGSHLTAKKPNTKNAIDKQLSVPGTGSAVSRWTPQVKMALAQLGLPGSALDLVLHRIGVESGGNPKAINRTDINAQNGDPSRGLMQTIGATFNHYAGPYLSRGIYDPMASIYAGLNYAVHRYGSGWQKALSGTHGYAKGTDGAKSGWAWVGEQGPELVKFGGGETVLPHGMSMSVARGYAKGTVKDPTNGLAVAAEKGVSTLATAVSKLYRLIQDAFSAGRISRSTESSLNGWLDRENKQLQGLVKKRADLAPKLKDANDKLKKIQADKKAMGDDISNQAKGSRNLTDVFNTGGVTVSGALSTLKARLAGIKKFASNLAKLSKLGYSKAIIAEVAKAGPDQGNAMAEALMSANALQVKDFNKTYGAIGTASDSLGKSVSQDYYAAGEKAAQGIVDGLKSKDNALVKQIEKLADTVASTLRKKFHVSSKTPVPSDLAILLTWLTGISQATNAPKKPKSKKPKKKKGYASGTSFASPGLALVGEEGPEIVEFGGGERVRNARQTAQMMGPRYEIHIHEAKSENTTNAVLRAMRYADVMYGGAAGGLPAAMPR
ncbi:transglycosylase SLT domain-containing protein [Streptomyces sp. NPDC047990]|uniref:transglycosylase SLT domain-containing protein n=1 Tax=Streptomyces sp. NPDC047990 TaxID=3365496 RepID=UPI003713CC16